MMRPCRIHAVFWFGIALVWFWFPFGLICKKMIFANEGKMIPNQIPFYPMLPTESDFHNEALFPAKREINKFSQKLYNESKSWCKYAENAVANFTIRI